MPWYVYLAHFFGGAFLANSVPHIVHGMSGHKFQTPFATPRGVGESSAAVNVLWGTANLAAGIALVAAVGPFSGALIDWIVLLAGGLATALYTANHFSRVRRGPAGP